MPNFPLVTDEAISNLVAPCPKTLWIELTSKCPFDCRFCSRRYERGDGQNMNFALYESLIAQLRQPETIRLNYSGESTHYPRLADAIRLAGGTGAATELVSALASATPPILQALVDHGLHRLSVSLHSLDTNQFRRIYGFKDISDTFRNLDALRQYKLDRGSQYPEIDFAFVAMQENLSQLIQVAEYGRAVGVKHISVHPVIRRSTIPIQFPNELDEGGQLKSGFAALLQAEVEKAAARIPDVSITIARPDRVPNMAVAGITTCEQNPWETVHVLAGGEIVVCEAQDHHEMGNLQRQSLADIWTGPAYAEFRRQYSNGGNATCMACPWRRTAAARPGESVTIRGWHPSVGETVRWSGVDAALAVTVQPGVSAICIAGLLPPAPDGRGPNRLTIRRGGSASVPVVNGTTDLLAFEAVAPLAPPLEVLPDVLHFETLHGFCPVERGTGPDLRTLGFALTALTMEYEKGRQKGVARLLQILGQLERLAGLRGRLRRRVPKAAGPVESGVSVLAPARDTPDLLPATLSAAQAALAQVREPSELIVLITGAEAPAYAALRRQFPSVKWIFRRKALDYGGAVEFGLRLASYPWVY
ncbi:MAG: SPASM domain-containing protein, partial [Bryobacteraceae bacterium]